MRLGLAVAIAGWCPTAAQISYRVGTAEALRGQKANGFIEVPKGVDAAIGIPLVVVNGARPGPVLALVAARMERSTRRLWRSNAWPRSWTLRNSQEPWW